MYKTLLPVVALVGLWAGDQLSTDYSAARTLRIQTETSFSIETTASEMEIDGELREPRDDRGGGGSESKTKIVQIDTIVKGSSDSPSKVRRTFEVVEGTSSRGDNERDLESPWVDVTIELTGDDSGDVEVEVVDGDEPDDKLLEGHSLALRLDAFLPADEVSEGDEWEIDADMIMRAMGISEQAILFPPPAPEERPEGEGRGRGGRGRWGRTSRGGGGNQMAFFGRVDWDGKATLTDEEEEVEGLNCIVIEIELESEGDMPERESEGEDEGRGGRGGGEMERENTYSVTIEGKLWFSLEEQRPVRLALEGELNLTSDMSGNFGERSFSRHTEQEGEFTYEVTITASKAE